MYLLVSSIAQFCRKHLTSQIYFMDWILLRRQRSSTVYNISQQTSKIYISNVKRRKHEKKNKKTDKLKYIESKKATKAGNNKIWKNASFYTTC